MSTSFIIVRTGEGFSVGFQKEMWSRGLIAKQPAINAHSRILSEEGLRYIFVGGPTASGKSSLAAGLAERINGELVNCDSIQIYRGFDIGSAKVGEPCENEPHVHLSSWLEWHQSCDAAQYAILARDKIRELNRQGKIGIVVGGSGLYFRSLRGDRFHQLPADLSLRRSLLERSSESLWAELRLKDPVRGLQIHPKDKLRCARGLELFLLTGLSFEELTKDELPDSGSFFSPLCTVLMNPQRAFLHKNISNRVDAMLRRGLVEEVCSLLKSGCPKDAKPMLSVGYKQVVEYLDGLHLRKDLPEKITAATRQYAKRQSTWFRKVSADFCLDQSPSIDDLAEKILAQIECH